MELALGGVGQLDPVVLEYPAQLRYCYLADGFAQDAVRRLDEVAFLVLLPGEMGSKEVVESLESGWAVVFDLVPLCSIAMASTSRRHARATSPNGDLLFSEDDTDLVVLFA
jgi:hypothetical protein